VDEFQDHEVRQDADVVFVGDAVDDAGVDCGEIGAGEDGVVEEGVESFVGGLTKY